MIRLQSPEDINALRQMLQQGIISNDDLNQMEIGGGYVATQPQSQQVGPNMSRKMRVVGYGNGQATDLGEEDMRATPIDYTRAGVDIPGIGKGHYSRDGRFAYVQGPEGMTKVVLGYDRQGSQRATMQDLAMQKARGEVEQTGLQNDFMAQRNQMLAAGPGFSGPVGPPSQKALEAQFGKPDAGMRWKADGSGVEPIPGGLLQQQARTASSKGQDAIGQIDAMIGQRDDEGNLVGDSKPHPGFEGMVGAPGIGKVFGYLWSGSDEADFLRRLKQGQGGAFMEAFNTLKGGGQITEKEGEKATAAITRMDTAQSEKEFIAAAMEFRNVLKRGASMMQERGGQPGGAASSTGRVVGQTYDTPKGPLIWLGNGQWRKP